MPARTAPSRLAAAAAAPSPAFALTSTMAIHPAREVCTSMTAPAAMVPIDGIIPGVASATATGPVVAACKVVLVEYAIGHRWVVAAAVASLTQRSGGDIRDSRVLIFVTVAVRVLRRND
jgi:hypothetical protein